MARYHDNNNRGNGGNNQNGGGNNQNGNGGGGGRGSRPTCDHCGKVGHLAQNCFNNPQSKSFRPRDGNANANGRNTHGNNSQTFNHQNQPRNQNQNQGPSQTNQNQNSGPPLQNHNNNHPPQHQPQTQVPIYINPPPPQFAPSSSRIDLNIVRATEGEDAVALFLAMDAIASARSHNGMIALLDRIVMAMEEELTGHVVPDDDVEMGGVE